MVPGRATACLGPHRIAFVGEGLPFYGGYSYGRWRVAARDHAWSVSGPGTAIIQVGEDTSIAYEGGPALSATALITFPVPGVYVVALRVRGVGNTHTHTGYRQVIVYPSRLQAFDGLIGISSVTASASGGAQVSLTLQSDMSFLLDIRNQLGYIPVVILAEYYFETAYGVWERHELGPNWELGNYRDDPRILFSGYIDTETLQIGVDKTTISMTCRTADLILEQMQSGTWGFFESAYDGAGITFTHLMTHDVIRHMLQEHTNFIDWHDTRLQYNMQDVPFPDGQNLGMEYKDWTFQQGAYWSNIQDIAGNQFEVAFVDSRSTLVVMPDRNMWPPEINQRPSDVDPGQPSKYAHRYMEHQPLSVIGTTAHDGWLVPHQITVQRRRSQALSYYKIIATLSYSNEEWGADHPAGAPLPASGRWTLIQGRYYADTNRAAAWARLWNFACRGYASSNTHYTLEVSFALQPYWRIGDIVELIYEDPAQGLAFQRAGSESSGMNGNWFEVVSYSIDISLEETTWQTRYQLRELTVYTAPVPVIPSVPSPPKPTP
jgi:hypothetical protein